MVDESQQPAPPSPAGDAKAQAASDAPTGPPDAAERPSRSEVEAWIGARLDDISGAGVGKVEGAYVDEKTGLPEWVLIRVGRFGHHCVVPAREAVAGVGHVWVPWDRNAIRRSPQVEPGGELTAEEELQLCGHYGIVEGLGRAGELANRPGDETTVAALQS
ncbi:MAG TPA: PRC-barrel domain-containing protein [Solirubrobacterales bacterium]|nr:PRC-barrel domain-containing protein [Solirubrobacterales bacterium]